MRIATRPLARVLALLAALGVIAGAVSGCGSSGGEETQSRAASGGTDGGWGVAAVSQVGRGGAVDILRCTVGGSPACSRLDGAMSPITQLAMQDGGPLFAGTFDGPVLRCDPNQPTSCDAVGVVRGATAVAAEASAAEDATPSVYVGTTVGYEGANGDIWRCPQDDPNATCRKVGTPAPGDFVASMAIISGSVYAGLSDGRILRCTTGATASRCSTFATPGGGIKALSPFRSTLGVATDEGVVWTCPTGASGAATCTKVASIPNAVATSVQVYGQTVYAGFALDQPDERGLSGAVLSCEDSSPCTPVELPAPVADPQEGDPSAAPVTALAAVSDNTLWVGQGTISSTRAEGAITKCLEGRACTTAWSDPGAGITAMTEVPPQ